MMNLKAISKALAALTAGIAVLIEQGLLSGRTENWVVGLTATIGAFLAVFAAPRNSNTDTTPQLHP